MALRRRNTPPACAELLLPADVAVAFSTVARRGGVEVEAEVEVEVEVENDVAGARGGGSGTSGCRPRPANIGFTTHAAPCVSTPCLIQERERGRHREV
jgi:hypothetical protein